MRTFDAFSKRVMKVVTLLSFALTIGHLPLSFVNAYYYGAGGCVGGTAAVGGTHLTNNPATLSFASRNVTLQIGGVTVPFGGSASLAATVPYNIVLSGNDIKGVLIRIEAPSPTYNTLGVITPGEGTQAAAACFAPVVGITHTCQSLKSFVSGKLQFPSAVTGVTLEITIVWINSGSQSKFSYGKYTINVGAAKPTPPTGPAPPSPYPPCPPPPSSTTCFSSYNTVEVKDAGTVAMSQVKIGDFVKTDGNQYTQVYGFGHYDHDREEKFLRMTFDDHDGMSDSTDASLEVSPQHFVFVKRNHGKQVSVRAIDVVVGDHLGDRIVTSIETVQRRGVYAPLTQSGDMIVSGTYASNYVDLFGLGNNWMLDLHVFAHFLFMPQRLFCGYFMETCKKESYINGYGFLAYIIVFLSDMVKSIGSMTGSVVSWIKCPFNYLFATEKLTHCPLSCLVGIGLVVTVVLGRKRWYGYTKNAMNSN